MLVQTSWGWSRGTRNREWLVCLRWEGGSYRNCKLASTMTTALLQKQLGSRGVECVSVDPGAVYSGLWSTSKIWGRPPASPLSDTLAYLR
ncbi:hypothetical protein CEUSTIGMA_g5403.t1 [Chlamydomonas eustigma]|uniref:Uncharacterized protein n=1 Tax=Chlamydomonas eustigma TaxID=1157962 RepID=A0A250X4H1_9CHLO|nr:hypothetical protein CEUSTIGMA_g5403.t1 [Chlamydomonas eustigma]|eukprot:GAX77961.1 hypothetical protein CEUSTIGMA_g5403.t1 [Chlamydomonas eustigma]